MLGLFGTRRRESSMDASVAHKKLTRFDTQHARRESSARVRKTHDQVAHTQDATPLPRSKPLIMAMRQQDPIDELHSEVGLNPNILRNALPQRFQKLDEKKSAALGHDAFQFCATGS